LPGALTQALPGALDGLSPDAFAEYKGVGWYRLAFETPADLQGARLHFDAAYDEVRVWLNGKPLGSHLGDYTPFKFEVSDLLAVPRCQRSGMDHVQFEPGRRADADGRASELLVAGRRR